MPDAPISPVTVHWHLARGLFWVPATVVVFGFGWENVVAVTLLYSAYANVESGIASWNGARAKRAVEEQER